MKMKIQVCSILLATIIPVSVFAQQALSKEPSPQPVSALQAQSQQTLLPDNYSVYTNGSTVINHPMQGFVQKTLPTNNDYKNNPGCYLACYSHDESNGIYSVGNNIYVNGQVRIAGTYKGRICIPTGYENKDTSKEDSLKVLCAKISTCTNNQCWAGGDTGGWFGIQ